MPVVQCSCGQRYKLPDSAIGRRARCKKCGGEFEVRAPLPVQAVPGPPRTAGYAQGDEAASVSWRGFLHSLTRSLLLAGSVHNVLTFLGVWFVLCAGKLAQNALFAYLAHQSNWISLRLVVILGFAWLVVEGWYMAYSLSTVQSTAGGEDDLPPLQLAEDIGEGLIDGVLAPMLVYLTTFFIAAAPAFTFVVVKVLTSLGAQAISLTDIITFFALLAVGLFVWPMCVLAASLGGLSDLAQVHRILASIGRTLPAYLCTLGVVYAAAAAWIAGFFLVGDNEENMWTTGLGIAVLMTGARAYTQLVAMRAIGSLYRHFKGRLAFEWE